VPPPARATSLPNRCGFRDQALGADKLSRLFEVGIERIDLANQRAEIGRRQAVPDLLIAVDHHQVLHQLPFGFGVVLACTPAPGMERWIEDKWSRA
jgi:hypothetical protein